ncbi:MAG: hypothetical protein ACQESF_00465 [Nanobdellota archaeon]
MSYKELIQIYNNRQEKLQNLMDDNSVNLEEARALQIKGAIDEISMFLRVLEQHYEKNANSSAVQINNIGNDTRRGLFGKMRLNILGE